MRLSYISYIFLLLAAGGEGRNVTFLLGTKEGVVLFNTATVTSPYTTPTTDWVYTINYHLKSNMAYYRTGYTFYRSTLVPSSDPVSVESSVVAKTSFSSGFAVDWRHNVIYWADCKSSCLKMMDLKGEHITTIFMDPALRYSIWRVEVDPVVGKLFWLASFTLEWSDLTGDNYYYNLSHPEVTVTSFTLDVSASRLFYVETIKNQDYNLYEVHYRADGTTTLINRSSSPQFRALESLVFLGDYLYWMNKDNEGVIYSQPLNMTGKPETIHTNHGDVYDMKVIDPDLQKPFSGHPCQHTTCSHFCVHQRGVARCLCPDEMVLITNTTCLGGDERDVTFLIGAYHMVNTFSTAAVGSMTTITTTNYTEVFTVDYHLEFNMVYFIAYNTLFRNTLFPNNASSNILVKEVGFCQGFAVDWVHSVIYWMNCSTISNSTSLKLMDLEGNNVTTVMERPGGHAWVRGMAVDPHVGRVFWVATGTMEMCDLTGENFQTNLSNPIMNVYTFSLHIPSRRLFYFSSSTLYEMSYNLDGTVGTTKQTSALQRAHVDVITVFGDYLYYTHYKRVYRILTTMEGPIKQIEITNYQVINDIRAVDSGLQKSFSGHPCQQTTCSHFCVHQGEVARCLCPDGMFLGNKMICSPKVTGIQFYVSLVGFCLQLVVLIGLLIATFSFMLHANGRYFEWPHWMT